MIGLIVKATETPSIGIDPYSENTTVYLYLTYNYIII